MVINPESEWLHKTCRSKVAKSCTRMRTRTHAHTHTHAHIIVGQGQGW